MTDEGLEVVNVDGQLDALSARVHDPRPSYGTGFPSLDAQLHKGGFQAGNLVILGGRMHTRKTAVALNMIDRWLRAEVPVGLLTLDESLPMYVTKLASVVTQRASEELEDLTMWDEPHMVAERADYARVAKTLAMSKGIRPTFADLTWWWENAEEVAEAKPEVVVIDYTSLMVHYRKSETQRVVGLFEELQTWTHEHDVVVVALHQAGRADEGSKTKYHGDVPMTAEGLLYGGEQQADIILATYRPANNYLGNMSMRTAQAILGDSFDEEKWGDAAKRVRDTKHSTFLQLLKNRPSTKGLNFEGVELVSPNESQYMEEAGEGLTDGMEWTSAA